MTRHRLPCCLLASTLIALGLPSPSASAQAASSASRQDAQTSTTQDPQPAATNPQPDSTTSIPTPPSTSTSDPTPTSSPAPPSSGTTEPSTSSSSEFLFDEKTEPAPTRQPWMHGVRDARWLDDNAYDKELRLRGTGAALIGIGLILGIAAPIIATTGPGSFTPITTQNPGDDGNPNLALSIGTNAGPLIGGIGPGLVGGTLATVGGKLVSDHYVEPVSISSSPVAIRKDQERRRNLKIVAGMSIGVGAALLVAAVAEGAIAGAVWSSIPDQDPDVGNVADTARVARAASLAVAFGSASLAPLGLGIGLLIGQSARPPSVSVAPRGGPGFGGLALSGRF